MADAGTEPAAAAHAAGCKELAGPHPALHVNELYVYAKKRHHDDVGKTFLVCTGHRQDSVPARARTAGTRCPRATSWLGDNRLAYEVLQEEPAATTAPSYIYELNAKTGDRLVTQAFAWPDENVQASVEVVNIIAPNGSIAWLAQLSGHDDVAVERIGADGARSTLASGQDIDPTSLTASPHGTTVSWIQNGQPASAPLA